MLAARAAGAVLQTLVLEVDVRRQRMGPSTRARLLRAHDLRLGGKVVCGRYDPRWGAAARFGPALAICAARLISHRLRCGMAPGPALWGVSVFLFRFGSRVFARPVRQACSAGLTVGVAYQKDKTTTKTQNAQTDIEQTLCLYGFALYGLSVFRLKAMFFIVKKQHKLKLPKSLCL